MAAHTGPKDSPASSPPGFEGFPFPVTSKPSEDKTGNEHSQSGVLKTKLCRACTDFKTWMNVQKRAATAAQVCLEVVPGGGLRRL